MCSKDLVSYSFNPQPMRKDHSIAGTTILQTTLEDAGNNFIDGDKSIDKVDFLTRFGEWVEENH